MRSEFIFFRTEKLNWRRGKRKKNGNNSTEIFGSPNQFLFFAQIYSDISHFLTIEFIVESPRARKRKQGLLRRRFCGAVNQKSATREAIVFFPIIIGMKSLQVSRRTCTCMYKCSALETRVRHVCLWVVPAAHSSTKAWEWTPKSCWLHLFGRLIRIVVDSNDTSLSHTHVQCIVLSFIHSPLGWLN